MLKKGLIIFFLSLVSITCVDAQSVDSNKVFYDEFNFIIHLAKNKLFTECENEFYKMKLSAGLNPLYTDSVNFYLGLEYYNEKKYDKAVEHFLSISDNVFFYYKANYLASIIQVEKSKPDSALAIINSIEQTTNVNLNELQQFEMLGLNLYQGNYKLFDSLANKNTFTNPIINEEFLNLKKYAIDQKNIKRKSPFVAGVLSAIIPGLGKVYSGNNGQALAAFLTSGLLATITAENYMHHGAYHPQTLFFAGMFSVFYIGNIWGSALSVQLVKTEKQFENKHNILVGIKMPISKFFN